MSRVDVDILARCAVILWLLVQYSVGLSSAMLPGVRTCSVRVQALSPTATTDQLGAQVIAAFIATCRWNMKCRFGDKTSCFFKTRPSVPYTNAPILSQLATPFYFHFIVRAAQNAIIALGEGSTDESIFAVIVLGSRLNTLSLIRDCWTVLPTCDWRQVQVEHYENDMVSAKEYRGFWVQYDGAGVVRVGGEDGTKDGRVLMEWNARSFHGRVVQTVHVGISAWKYSEADWVFYQSCD
ncbi:uncharacterized protein LOC119739481 [Patiria miniata]|uniref:Farnesoic acid O-methyl transferase domain-containing protein n=1 Tax=Patiria miniata TaxID=46514 RepID=A0A914B2Y9_PATMI|nr:uncharacterized protein LOC119739481 [Patiria miniata]